MNTQNSHNIDAINNSATLSLCLSIGVILIGPFGSIPGIILGNGALKSYKRLGVLEGQGMAKAGIIVGWIGLLFWMIAMIAGIWFYMEMKESLKGINNRI